jgi:NAD(P)H-flavin reductase/hemoglobin-like flavoprotein
VDTQALRDSWRQVEGLGDEASAIFYSLLFTADPQLRTMFPAGMTEQRDKLLKALGHIVANVDDGDQLTAFAAQLGRDHRRFGVMAHHYQTVGRALLETLRRGLGREWTPHLAANWRAAYDVVAQIMIDAAVQDSEVNPPSWPATVEYVERRTADLTVFTVAAHHPYPYLPGQSCAMQHPARPAVWRYMSPANAPRSDHRMEFHVRAIPGGQVSPVLTYRLRAGDVIQLGAPVGTALTGWHGRAPSDLLLVAGGTGLAPFRAIVEYLSIMPDWQYTVTLVMGADTEADLYDLPAVRQLQHRVPWLRVVPAVSRDPGWGGFSGSAIDVALQIGTWDNHDIYVCGSESMVATSLQRLRVHGYDRRRVYVETFTSRSYPAIRTAELPTEVTQ